MPWKKFWIAVVCTFLLSCEESPDENPALGNGDGMQTAIQKGNRTLGMTVIPAEDGNYDGAMDVALEAGIEVTNLSLNWRDIETAPGVYDDNLLSIANTYYPAKGVAITLSLRTINTNQLEVPNDLQATRFDDPIMIQRFEQLLDFVFAQLGDVDLHSISLGNEINAYLGTDATLWAQYTSFYQATADYVRSNWPGLPVGAKVTYKGMTGPAADKILQLNAHSDVIMVTYYPLNDDFTVQTPSVVFDDFQFLIDSFSDKPIYIMELGYPSGALCNSSEALQQEFVEQSFAAWDAYRERIPFLLYLWLNDLSSPEVASLTSYYGFADPVFAEYLATLGLRTHAASGQDKAAFTRLKALSTERGW